MDTLELYDPDDDLVHTIPVSTADAGLMANNNGVSEGQLRYEQYLGERPSHGQYRVVAIDERDETVDSVTVESNCFSDVSEE